MFQFLPHLENKGIEYTIHVLLGDWYVNALYSGERISKLKIAASYFQRIKALLRRSTYDIIWMQQEAFPWIPAWIEKLILGKKKPIIVDYDDAFFHRYNMHPSKIIRTFLGKKIDRIMEHSSAVVAGNSYLANHAKESKAKSIVIIPTVVDTNIYTPSIDKQQDVFTIGWIGSPHTAKYLKVIENPLSILSKEKDTVISIVGSGPFSMDDCPLQIIKWSEADEVSLIQQFDVGVMPLSDNPWERGKCGFKLIQYMACGIPVIASPVGVNSSIVQQGINGYLANSDEEWITCILKLKNSPELRNEMGRAGRRMAEEKYSLHVAFLQLISLFEQHYKMS